MPDQSANLSTIRAQRYWCETYVSTPAETVIFRALVNMASISYPVTAITFDNVTVGAFTDIAEDMEVLVYSGSSSTIKGRLRVAPGASTASVLQVNEVSKGRVSISDNDKIEVLRSWRVRDRLVGATSSFPKDSRVAYSDQGANPQPICNSGGHWVGFVDDGQTYATVVFTGSTSSNVDPDSGSTVNHLWDVGDGTITVGTSTSASPTVRFPVGERWVKHTATDASNSKVEVQYVWVKVYSQTANLPLDVSDVQISGTPQDGWRASFTIPAGRTLTEMPDGALIVIWQREYYDSTVVSYGAASTGRSHIRFVGYLIADSVRQDMVSGNVSFEAISPLALLAQLPGFSQVLKSVTSPTNWRGIKTLTTNRALLYCLRWGTTLLRTHDLVLSGNNYNYPQFYIQTQTPDEQVRELADGLGAIFTCDARGRFLLTHDLQVATTAQRTAATTTVTLAEDDIDEAEWDREHRYEYGVVEGRGFVGGTTQRNTKPVLSIAPGKAPSEAPGNTAVERQIVEPTTGQTTLNERTGRLYAKLNRLYFGLPTLRGRIRLRGAFDIFDFYGEWLKITLASSYNKRGIALSSTRFVIESIDVEYTPEMGKNITLTVQQETDGDAGILKRQAQTGMNNLPAIQSPRLDFLYFTPAPPASNPMYTGKMALIADNKNVYTTGDWWTPEASGGPTWTANSISASVSGTMVAFAKDYFSPLFVSGSGAVNGWIVTTTNVYRIADIGGARTITNQLTFPSSTQQRTIITSRTVSGWAVVASQLRASGGTVLYWTTDGGSTWNGPVTVTTHYNTNTSAVLSGDNFAPAIALGDHPDTLGNVYVVAFTATGASTAATTALYRVPNYGAGTPVQLTTMSGSSVIPGALLIPYHNNPTDSLFHWSKTTGTGVSSLTYARTNGSTQETINPASPANPVGSFIAVGGSGFVHMIDACPTNRNYIGASMGRVSGASVAAGFYTSVDGGTTWVERVAPVTTNRWESVWADDLTPGVYFLGSSGLVVGVTFDNGLTIESKRGNLGTGNNILGIVGYA